MNTLHYITDALRLVISNFTPFKGRSHYTLENNHTTVITQNKSFDFNLEALRGIAAISVLWGHVIHYEIDPGFSLKGALAFDVPGHLCVLLFFILSGYVIGLTNSQPLTSGTVLKYLKKRVVRIYPIYFISLVLAFAVSKTTFSPAVVYSHLFMTQGITSPLVREINPSWSLVYEMVFYLLFIPISAFRLNPMVVALVTVGTGILCACFYPVPGMDLLASYFFGFTFWLAGLWLAQTTRGKAKTYSYGAMVSLLLLLFSSYQLDAPVTVFYRIFTTITHHPLNLPGAFRGPNIIFRDLGFLPFCLVVVLFFIGRGSSCKTYIVYFLLAAPALTFPFFYRHHSFSDSTILISCILYGLSLVAYILKVNIESAAKKFVNKLFITGNISYGIYIIHFPILCLFTHSTYLSGSLATFWIRVTLFFLITTVLAYLLERRFQPFIKKLFSA